MPSGAPRLSRAYNAPPPAPRPERKRLPGAEGPPEGKPAYWTRAVLPSDAPLGGAEGYALCIRTVDACRRSQGQYLKFQPRVAYRMAQDAFPRTGLSSARRAERFATSPFEASSASACAGRLQKERWKMMNVATRASCASGQRHARTGRDREGGSDACPGARYELG